ncbi:hypothetical protein D3C76_1161450 [compost metagenome]
MGAIVIHHRISYRTRCGSFQLRHVHCIHIVRTGSQPGNTAVTHVHFTLRRATYQISLVRQRTAVGDRTRTQGNTAIGTGNRAHTNGDSISPRRH